MRVRVWEQKRKRGRPRLQKQVRNRERVRNELEHACESKRVTSIASGASAPCEALRQQRYTRHTFALRATQVQKQHAHRLRLCW